MLMRKGGWQGGSKMQNPREIRGSKWSEAVYFGRILVRIERVWARLSWFSSNPCSKAVQNDHISPQCRVLPNLLEGGSERTPVVDVELALECAAGHHCRQLMRIRCIRSSSWPRASASVPGLQWLVPSPASGKKDEAERYRACVDPRRPSHAHSRGGGLHGCDAADSCTHGKAIRTIPGSTHIAERGCSRALPDGDDTERLE